MAVFIKGATNYCIRSIHLPTNYAFYTVRANFLDSGCLRCISETLPHHFLNSAVENEPILLIFDIQTTPV